MSVVVMEEANLQIKNEEQEEGGGEGGGSVRFGCLFTRKPGLGYSRGANYSQAGGWTTGYPLITPGSSRGVPTTVSSCKPQTGLDLAACGSTWGSFQPKKKKVRPSKSHDFFFFTKKLPLCFSSECLGGPEKKVRTRRTVGAGAANLPHRRLVQGLPTCPHALLSQSPKDPHLPYVTTLLNSPSTLRNYPPKKLYGGGDLEWRGNTSDSHGILFVCNTVTGSETHSSPSFLLLFRTESLGPQLI
jgi:hypothetical protein